MSIDQPAVIDFLWKEGRNNRTVLTISDHLDWEDEGEHLILLQDKLNHYLEFVESGQLGEAKPEFKGPSRPHPCSGSVSLECAGRQVLRMVKERVAELGFSLEFDLGGKLIKET